MTGKLKVHHQPGRFRFRQRTRADLALALRRDGILGVAAIGSTLCVQSPTTLYIMHASIVARNGEV